MRLRHRQAPLMSGSWYASPSVLLPESFGSGWSLPLRWVGRRRYVASTSLQSAEWFCGSVCLSDYGSLRLRRRRIRPSLPQSRLIIGYCPRLVNHRGRESEQSNSFALTIRHWRARRQRRIVRLFLPGSIAGAAAEGAARPRTKLGDAPSRCAGQRLTPYTIRYSRGTQMPSGPRYDSWNATKSRLNASRTSGSNFCASTFTGP